ncbi:hypothetical protein [Salinimicrobium oceani]|uniref:DUF4382 domain-containing protein n=1 Tax=Salinimicrobium oceani TaxID=2722702 RepID=A0ABX1CYG0_9FLAO|nr:hypothetical protein [Salinimicrobium oceani]NJW51443.1 hypothetical protein [Salinimicrobium oceani]
MKKTKLLSAIFLSFSLLFASCSKEDESPAINKDTAYLSFHTLLNDLAQKQQNKQVNSDIPECSDGIPAFVEIILSLDEVYVAGSESTPLRLDLHPNPSDMDGDGALDYFTEESATLELVPGTYTLEYFTVLDADGNVLWIAPMDDGQPGGIDDMVEQSLPMDINLGAGVKKYQNVEVVCFDDRNVNQYGYLFFDLNGYEVIEFCIFGNYCDETGRHAEFIQYEVDVWKFSGDAFSPKGDVLHENLQNSVIVTDYEDYAETNSLPLCFTLPDGPGFDEYYIEITQLQPGPEPVLIRSGLISDVDVRNLFSGDEAMEYYHFREGNCNLSDDPILLSDHRNILDVTWEFTFNFGDAMIAADVDFYADGTASYKPYGDEAGIVWGTWSFFDNYLFYDPDGDQDILGFLVSGKWTNNSFSGDFWHNGVKDSWSGYHKN